MISAFAPLWIVTLAGWACARFGVLSPTLQQGLGEFAFTIAIPAVVFTTIVRLDDVPVIPLAAFAVSTVVVGVLVYLLSPARTHGEKVINSMAGAYVNSGNLGIPLAIYVLGDASLVVIVVAFQTVIVTPLIVGLLDAAPKRLWSLPLRVPVVLASLAGVLVLATGITLPEVMTRPLDIIGGAAAPAALFALGMSLHAAEKPNLANPSLWLATSAKVVAQPLIAFAAAKFLFGLDGLDLLAVTLFAGLPTAQNTFVYASQYKVPNGLSRDAVLVTSVLSLLSLSVILGMIGS